MEFCARCQTQWFNQRLSRSVCQHCRDKDAKMSPGEPFFYSHKNNLDFGDVPSHLPPLSQIEEILIAQVHVHVQIFQHRSQQYKYRGHVVNFLRNTGSVYSQLPLLPPDLDVIILRPANETNQPHMTRQFRHDFHVRQSAIRQWLLFLKQQHPGYRDILIDEDRLSQLPVDDNVSRQVFNHRQADAIIDEEIPSEEMPEEGDFDGAAVPNLIAAQADLDELQDQLQGQTMPNPEQIPLQQQYLRMPDIRSTPLNEFNRSQPLLSLAFPTLYPRGQANFVQPRVRSVTYKQYINHAMKWHDGRFAKHPRFRYVAFNTLMRHSVNTRSSFFIKRPGQTANRLVNLEDLRAAFNQDTPEARALLNSIIHYSGNLRGTRAFWNSKRRGLEAMVRAIGCPGTFLTFSAADHHWESLQRHMPYFNEWQTSSHRNKVRIAIRNLRDNPHIAAHHFHSQFTSFLHTVLMPRINITEY